MPCLLGDKEANPEHHALTLDSGNNQKICSLNTKAFVITREQGTR